MEVSIGIYALIFISFFLVIPGFIARRFYYNGEFSKQVNWNNNALANLLSSLFVGICLAILFISIYNLISSSTIDTDIILSKFDSYFISPENSVLINKFSGFTDKVYNTYLPFIGGMYVFSAMLGFFLSKIVLFFNLDVKWKIFRFSNNWHYLFSGRILKMKKGSGSKNDEFRKVKYTYLDILVSEKGDETTLYSGLYANYDVCSKDINKLEKIYLYRATRYKKIGDKNLVRNIPGDIFTIMGDKILNINATFYFYDAANIKDSKFLNLKKFLIPVQLTIVLSFLFLLVSILFSFNLFSIEWLSIVIQKSMLSKIMIILSLNFLLGVILPFKIDNKKRSVNFIGLVQFGAQMVLFIIFSLLAYYISS